MGGSGRKSHIRTPTRVHIIRTEDQTRTEKFETDVNHLLISLLSEFNERDVKGIRKVLDQVESDLESEIEGTIDTLFGGSISKHTYLEGISDVDTLVVLNNSELAEKSPSEVKTFLAECLCNRYGKDKVWEGNLAVTIDLEGKSIQFLPALRHGQGVRIASSDGSSWSKVNPQRFAEALTKANGRMDRKLVPCIKLIKAIVARRPEREQITGYHVESMAINVFRGYDGRKTHKSMLRHFFEEAPKQVMKPIRDSSGQSVHVDEYLGAENSPKRGAIAGNLREIRSSIRRADRQGSFDGWKELFE